MSEDGWWGGGVVPVGVDATAGRVVVERALLSISTSYPLPFVCTGTFFTATQIKAGKELLAII